MSSIAIHRIADGRLVEHWSQIGVIGLLQQLGVVPAFAQELPVAGVSNTAVQRG